MKSIARPAFLSAVRRQSTASHAVPKTAEHRLVPQEAKVTRLPNGVIVASIETYTPVSHLAVVYNAGSRYEPSAHLGLTHCLRAAVNQSSHKATAFGIAKNIQQIGASLTCTTNREQVIYSLECLREDLSTGWEFLKHISTTPSFRPWEIKDSEHRLHVDLEVYEHTLEARLVEAIHKAAYRDTLGNSLFVQEDNIGSFSPKDLESFVASRYVSNNVAVAGVGIDHELLVNKARKITLPQGAALDAKKSKYHGRGEIRIDVRSPLVHAAVVTEGVSYLAEDAVPLSVLLHVLGTRGYVKHGANITSSRLNKAVTATTNNPIAVSGIGAFYTDGGLFGFQIAANAKDIGKALKAAVTTVTDASKTAISDADVQRAKRQLKSFLHLYEENPSHRLEGLAIHALTSGQVGTASTFDAAIDKVTADDVNRVAKKVINGKPVMAAIGDLSETPYLDELL